MTCKKLFIREMTGQIIYVKITPVFLTSPTLQFLFFTNIHECLTSQLNLFGAIGESRFQSTNQPTD